ncbi:MAG: hypothetical protein ACI86X_001719 [Moritella sp.]|jgi:hypothetical protein
MGNQVYLLIDLSAELVVDKFVFSDGAEFVTCMRCAGSGYLIVGVGFCAYYAFGGDAKNTCGNLSTYSVPG